MRIFFQPLMFDGYTLREALHSDSRAVMTLIDNVYREYGDKLMPEDADADLINLEENYTKKDSIFVVVEAPDGSIVASHSVVPRTDQLNACWFKRLYLHPTLRGGVWGNILMNWAIVSAQRMGFKRVEFWSDSRFKRAHAFFGRFGFQRDGRVRSMTDGSMPYDEYFFYLDLDQANLVEPNLDFSYLPAATNLADHY